MEVEKKIKEMGFTLPPPPKPVGAYLPFVRTGNLVFISGQLPFKEGKLIFKGKVGKDLTVEEGYRAAQQCTLNLLGILKEALGDLMKVKQVVMLMGYVNSAEGFTEQSKVLNGASDLLLKIFGDKGKHSRLAIGVSELPLNAPIEISMIIEATGGLDRKSLGEPKWGTERK